MPHTPGPWHTVEGKSFILADNPTGWNDAENIEMYGGYLVCESVTPADAPLIAAAPDLLAVLKAVDNQWLFLFPTEIQTIVTAAIAKAEGRTT